MTEHTGDGPRGVRVRFAPSPSGDLHVGNIRTALYAWAFARRTGGTFVLRIEDTDQTRVTQEYINSALDTLRWLGLGWDEGPEVGGPYAPYLQSERMASYADWAQRFRGAGDAYYCYCTQEELAERRAAARASTGGGPTGYDGHCRDLTPEQMAAYAAEGRPPVLRFRMPAGSTTFTDLVLGEVTVDHAHVPDFVLVRADGSPLYTLAVAVDDVLMKITHVVRGQDLLSSTPRQIAVYRACRGIGGDTEFTAELLFVDRHQPSAAIGQAAKNPQHAVLGAVDELYDAAAGLLLAVLLDADQGAVADAGGFTGLGPARRRDADHRRRAMRLFVPFGRPCQQLAVFISPGDVGEDDRR